MNRKKGKEDRCFRFDFVRIGTSIRTDRTIQIFDPSGKVLGHISVAFGSWLLSQLIHTLDRNTRDKRLLFESLDDAVKAALKHERSLNY